MTTWFPQSPRESEPLFYFRGHPVDVSLFLVFAHIATMLLCFGLIVSDHGAWANGLSYTGLSLHHPFNIILYPFIHNIASEGVFFLWGLVELLWFGRPVEQFIGKTSYILLLSVMTVVPALIMTFIPPISPALNLSGFSTLHFGLFLTFALIYPDSQLILGLVTKWVALGFLGVYTLVFIAGHNWVDLTWTWLTAITAWEAMQFLGSDHLTQWFHNWQTERQASILQKRREKLEKKEQDFHSSVDSILEKISRDGIQSLTARERDQLERARAKLLRSQQKN